MQLAKEMGAGKFRPLYFFYGEEDFRKAEAIKLITKGYLPPPQRKLNLVKMSASGTDFTEICTEIIAIPMLGEKRLIVIEQMQKMKPTQHKKLFEFLSNPPPETVIIMTVPGSYNLKKTSAFYKGITAISAPVIFDRLTGGMARAKIEKHFRDAGFEFDSDAVDYLIAITGGNFGGLGGELEKLSLATEGGGHIGLAEVKQMVSSHEEYNIFELIDCIADLKTEQALHIFNDLILKGINPASMIYPLSNHMTNLLKVHAGKKVAAHPMFVGKLRRQAAIYDQSRTVTTITLIAKADREIRENKLRPLFLVENLIREISL